MYKCGHASQSEAATLNHLQPGGSNNLHCIARSCGSCQMSAFQVASMFKSSMRSAAAAAAASTTAVAIKPQRNHIAAAVGGVITNNSSSINNNCATAATKKSSIQFHCEFCSFSCTWRYDLKLHLRQKHGIHQLKKV
ncbi:Hypothetical predicted protein [Drosophila guanche]|uniref:C2H2-type domain-containing protein n=1 Tax=Drosophila guanche TaxID=7266 RepID=A0A3B0J0A6_DROGU|nr:Hypothetical predicted protein [Drosophila guanche]